MLWCTIQFRMLWITPDVNTPISLWNDNSGTVDTGLEIWGRAYIARSVTSSCSRLERSEGTTVVVYAQLRHRSMDWSTWSQEYSQHHSLTWAQFYGHRFVFRVEKQRWLDWAQHVVSKAIYCTTVAYLCFYQVHAPRIATKISSVTASSIQQVEQDPQNL
jgi:hypothetical protein